MPDAAAKADDSERRRIVVILDKFAKEMNERTLLEGYYRALIENMNAGKMTLRSVRLALSPAAALLCQAGEKGCIQPNQKILDAYLDKKPGQRAAISGFVRYLREVRGIEIALPKANLGRVHRQRRKKLEAELLTLMKEGGQSKKFKRRWLSVSLMYFHGLKRNVGLIVKDTDIYQIDDGLVITWNNKSYWVASYPK